jgi:8-amino-7-oxononanoate synthase
MFEAFATEKLLKKEAKDSIRSLKLSSGIDFSSNDYLGFAKSQDVMDSFKKNVSYLTQMGSTGSRLLSGHKSYHHEAEERIAHYFGSESALLFSSGYLLNIGLIQCLADETCTLLIDELCHNSFKAGAKASKAESFYFRHNDLTHLRERLEKHRHRKCFILIESLYSMDGDIAPLKEIVILAEEFGAEIIIDEAHATGVIGSHGKGLVSSLNLESQVLARVITFGKGLGVEGAAVLGPSILKKYLVNFCQTFIYTTALSYPLILMINTALDHFRHSEIHVKKLHRNMEIFSSCLGIPILSPIYAWMMPSKNAAKEVAAFLIEKGFDLSPIVSPTVQRGKERIRIVLHSFNTEEEIRSLCLQMNRIL